MTPVASSHVRAIADPTKRWSRPLGAVSIMVPLDEPSSQHGT